MALPKRAGPGYDAFYGYPWWHDDVAALKALIVPFFEGHDVRMEQNAAWLETHKEYADAFAILRG